MEVVRPQTPEETHETTLMSTKKLTQKVRKAMRDHELVRFARSMDGVGWLEGYVVAVGKHWVAMALVTSGEPDGWTIFLRSDLRSIWTSPSDRFMRRLLELDGQWPPAAPTASLPLDGTVRELVDSAGAAFPLVAFWTEAEDDSDIYYVGRPFRWTSKKLYWSDLNPNAEWSSLRLPYKQSDITRITVGGRYETSLARVAQPCPRLPQR